MSDEHRPAIRWTEDDVADVLANPVYAGIGPYAAIVDERTWVRAVARIVKENGAEETLLRMLLLLREAFPPGTTLPPGGGVPSPTWEPR